MGKETDKEIEDGFLRAMGGIVIGALLLAYFIWTNGFIAMYFYNWFVKPVLKTPEYSLYQFIGFSVFVRVLVPRGSEYIKSEFKDEDRWYKMLIAPWLIFALGFVIQVISH